MKSHARQRDRETAGRCGAMDDPDPVSRGVRRRSVGRLRGVDPAAAEREHSYAETTERISGLAHRLAL
jgi:hypothetical protein